MKHQQEKFLQLEKQSWFCTQSHPERQNHLGASWISRRCRRAVRLSQHLDRKKPNQAAVFAMEIRHKLSLLGRRLLSYCQISQREPKFRWLHKARCTSYKSRSCRDSTWKYRYKTLLLPSWCSVDDAAVDCRICSKNSQSILAPRT